MNNHTEMNILHIIPNLKKGGAERLVTDIVRELSKRTGINVHLVLFSEEIEFDISDIQNLISIIPSSVELSTWKKNKFYIDELQRFIDDFQPDIIHTHLFEAEIAPRIKPLKKCRFFSHAHCNTKELQKPSFQNLFSKQGVIDYYVYYFVLKLFKKCNNKFIAISKHTTDFYIENTPTFANEIFYRPNAIKLSRFLLEKKRNINAELFKIVSVGSLNNNKNQIFQIKVAKFLRDMGCRFTLEIIGTGVAKNQLNKEIKSNNLTEHVSLIGATDFVEDHLHKSDFFIHTAIYEAFGLAIVEAMAAGLPIISFNGGGNNEVIKNGVNGYLIEELNPETFAKKIIALTKDSKKYQRFSSNAVKTAENYDIDKYVDNLLNLYTS